MVTYPTDAHAEPKVWPHLTTKAKVGLTAAAVAGAAAAGWLLYRKLHKPAEEGEKLEKTEPKVEAWVP